MISALLVAATSTPSPTSTTVDEAAVTPGPIGFIAIFLVAIAVVLLVLDMVRRVRRVNYRDQVRAQLDAEQAEDDSSRG